MIFEELIEALQLPASTRVDQRIPKKTLVEHGAPTAADKRYINDGIEELYWVAALKPSTIGVPAYSDAEREYLEIAVLTLTPRPGSKLPRLVELIHRAIPYPLFLCFSTNEGIALSFAHKRWSQGEAGKTVLDGEVYQVPVKHDTAADTVAKLKAALHLASQPRASLLTLYQGWIDTALALEAATLTRDFTVPATAEYAQQRREALVACSLLEAQIGALRKAAEREKQMAKRVDLNMQLQKLQQEYETALGKL